MARPENTLIQQLMPIRTASLFSGAMGLDIGLEHHGFETVLAVEYDKDAQATIQANRPKVDIATSVFDLDLIQKIKQAQVEAIVGGPPCQSWSYAGTRQGLEDHRGLCIPRFLDIVAEVKPPIVIMENVLGLFTATIDGVKGAMPDYILKRLGESGYITSISEANSADYGAPQCRKRIIVIATLGALPPVLAMTHTQGEDIFQSSLPPWRTLRNAIGGMQHVQHEFNPYPQARAKLFAMLTQGQNWRNLPKELHREALGNASKKGGCSGYCRRLAWDKPSPTLLCSPTQKFSALCHPEEVRPLSVQEYARIQEFPEDWVFKGSLASRYKQIGNAVPIKLAEAIGKALTQAG